MQPRRLAQGGRIDRGRTLAFSFGAKRYEGFAGDTLASALLANGVDLVGRSFKYHRPRGILSAGSEEPNALVQLESGAYGEPNLRATQIELYDGLQAAPVNAWPSLEHDLGALVGVLAPLFVAGFYYKTFMWPRAFWHRVYEPAIRRMAGMGKAPTLPDAQTYDKMHVHCDVLVVGGGPAGLAAALAAGRSDARVILVDEQNEPGGALLSGGDTIDGGRATAWVATTLAELVALPEVTVLRRTTAFGYYDDNYLMLVERRTDHLGPGGRPGTTRQRLWHVRAREVVLATGAHERPLVFPDNDRPGIMLAGAVAAYLGRYAVAPGRRAVIFANNDSGYRTALALAEAGVAVAAVVDPRPSAAGTWPDAARRRGIEILPGHAVVATAGSRRLTGIEVMALAPGGAAVASSRRRIHCDLLAMSGGWNPAVHLFSQAQGKLVWDETLAAFVPGRAAQRLRAVGACRGSFGLADCLADGLAAGAAAAAAAGFGDGEPPPAPTVPRVTESALGPLWLVPSDRRLGHDRRKRFVDFQNDVTAADIRLAAREGFHSVEHVKHYTTTGMGTDQGKTSNVNALALLSRETERTIAATGTTTFRAPYTPVSYGVLAGRDRGPLVDPVRVTAIHDWHEAKGAVFEDVGQWKRPRHYPRPGEDMATAVRRECRAVQETVGVLDASTLGKIDITGRDAVAFLDRVYTNAWGNLGVGRCRYGLMCRDDGMVFDDGVTTRLGPEHFVMTTTTGNAARVLEWLEEWLQTEWPELEVYCSSVTEDWATVTLSGPRSRALLADLAPGLALDAASFPFMSLRQAEVAGIPARILRVSFTGELSFEINVAAWHAMALWEAVMAAGAAHGAIPYGTEAMHVLRAEKGFIIVGQDTDGSVTPQDLGMDWIVSKRKDFIGQRSQHRSDTERPDRKQLVGLLPEDPKFVLPEGAQLVLEPRRAPPMAMVGHVTSSYWGERIGRSFALALVKGGRGRIGQTVHAPLGDRTIRATIAEPLFYDPEGRRRDG